MTYIFQPFRKELELMIVKYAGVVTGHALDIGAGTYDRYSSLFTKTTAYVRMNVIPGPRTDLVGRVEAIPADNAAFDSLVCTQVIGDVFDLSKAFAEFSRVLKPGGHLLLTESFMDPLHDEPFDHWRFTPHSLRALCEENGFEIEAIERVGGYHTVLVQFSARYWIERMSLYGVWYARVASAFFKLRSAIGMWRDQRDTSSAGKKFAHGWLLVARKK